MSGGRGQGLDRCLTAQRTRPPGFDPRGIRQNPGRDLTAQPPLTAPHPAACQRLEPVHAAGLPCGNGLTQIAGGDTLATAHDRLVGKVADARLRKGKRGFEGASKAVLKPEPRAQHPVPDPRPRHAAGRSEAGGQFYFVHSYYVETPDASIIWGETDYGGPFVSAIRRGRCFATQFHPEKSGDAGIRMLQGWLADPWGEE